MSQSAAVIQHRSAKLAHCFVCAPWVSGWALRRGETYVTPRIVRAENVERVQEVVDELLLMGRRGMFPCNVCFRPPEAHEFVSEGAYLLSFRFREAHRTRILRRIDSLFQSDSGTFSIVRQRDARAHGLFSRRNGMRCLDNQDQFIEVEDICA
jgi:hypothetical protein